MFILLCPTLFIFPAAAQTTGIDIPFSVKKKIEQILYRRGYAVSYNKDTKTPNWVAWHLATAHLEGDAPRPNAGAFHEDAEVPAPRANNEDYKGSGWSRGHMCPAGDNKWDSTAMYESFLLTNVCPQSVNLNSGVWNQIEISCRQWAAKYGGLDIVCGPIYFNQEHDTIGANRVVVPEAFFKVVLCLQDKPKGIGFICRNMNENKKKEAYVHSINQIERITGYTFFPHLDPLVSEQVKSRGNLKEW
ncbi:MAG: DNA/RNA non-specific endonuclease [Bacteroidaceae bacterium]|nr:DNA/RNA non-specific endonuclease [Bacteroidaceae bacterium]